MDPVLDYIKDKEWEYRISGDEIILKRCVFCGREDWKLYVNRKSRLFICHHASCAARGHISKLKQHVGDIIDIEGFNRKYSQLDFTTKAEMCHDSLVEREDILRYLDDRGITLEAVNRFQLGILKHRKNIWLSYPCFVGGVARYIKYRLLPFEYQISSAEKAKGLSKFWHEKDAAAVLFNQDCIAEHTDIIITEGEKDAISLLMQGYDNVVGVTEGASNFRTEWYDLLKEKEKIYLCFDSDEAGQKGARDKWASRLGYAKCYNVVLPSDTKDVTEFFLSGRTKDEFDKLIAEAKVFDIPGIRSVYSILRNPTSEEDEDDIAASPWPSVNQLLGGGLSRGQLLVLSSPPKIGKTTFAMQWSAHLVRVYRKPVLFFCMEMPQVELAKMFVCHYKYKAWEEFSWRDAPLMADTEYMEIPMYIGFSPRVTITQIQQTFLAARERFGIEFFVFDNLHTLIRENDNVVEKIGIASKMFKELAMEMNLPILLIAQPRKMEKGQVMDYYDIKGSSDIPADADKVCILHRSRETSCDEAGRRTSTFSLITRFIVDASRWSAGGECRLLYNPRRHAFDEAEHIYGQEERELNV